MNLKTISSKLKKTCLFILTILKNKKFYLVLFTSIITYITWGYTTIEKRVDDLMLKHDIQLKENIEKIKYLTEHYIAPNEASDLQKEKDIERLVRDRRDLLYSRRDFEFLYSELGDSIDNLMRDIRDMLTAILMNNNLAYQSLETQKSFELVKQHVLYTPFLNCRLYDKIATYSYILRLNEIEFTHLTDLYYSSTDEGIKISILRNTHCYTELNNTINRIYTSSLPSDVIYNNTYDELISRKLYNPLITKKAYTLKDPKKAKEYFKFACENSELFGDKDTEACQKYAELNEQGF